MIANTRAGSRGARRIHPWRRASGRGRARRAVVTVGASAVIWASVGLTWRWNWSSRRPVRVADGLGVELGLRARRRHGLLAGHRAGGGVLDRAYGGGGVVPHGGVALAVERGALGEAGLRGARLAVLLQHRHVRGDRALHFGTGQRRLPRRVEPASAE